MARRGEREHRHLPARPNSLALALRARAASAQTDVSRVLFSVLRRSDANSFHYYPYETYFCLTH